MMRVLMQGWEFLPIIRSGLGKACYGLIRVMVRLGVEIIFVLPRAADNERCGDMHYAKTRPLKQNRRSWPLLSPVSSSGLYSPYQSTTSRQNNPPAERTKSLRAIMQNILTF
jgi:hypothetical protein